MIKNTLTLCLLLLGPGMFAQEPLKPTDDPEVLHKAAMENLEQTALEWEKIAQDTGDLSQRSLYTRVAESYRTWALIREERFTAEKNQQAVNYELYLRHRGRHNFLVEEATTLYGEGAPKPPEEVKPQPKPEVVPTPTPTPEKSYTTESGFTVTFRLEE